MYHRRDEKEIRNVTKMTEKERMLSGRLYNPYKVEDKTWQKNRKVLEEFNAMSYQHRERGMQLLRGIFGDLGRAGYI